MTLLPHRPPHVGPGVAEHKARCTVYFVWVKLTPSKNCRRCGQASCPSKPRSVDIPGATVRPIMDSWAHGQRIRGQSQTGLLRGIRGFGRTTRGGSNQRPATLAPSSLANYGAARSRCQRTDARGAISRTAQKATPQSRTQPAPARQDAALCLNGDAHGWLADGSRMPSADFRPTLLPSLVGRGCGWVDAGLCQGRTLRESSISKFASATPPSGQGSPAQHGPKRVSPSTSAIMGTPSVQVRHDATNEICYRRAPLITCAAPQYSFVTPADRTPTRSFLLGFPAETGHSRRAPENKPRTSCSAPWWRVVDPQGDAKEDDNQQLHQDLGVSRARLFVNLLS